MFLPSSRVIFKGPLLRGLAAGAVGAAGMLLAAGASAQALAPVATPAASVQGNTGTAGAGNAKAGQGIAQNGLPAAGVAACAVCHGARGEGGPAFPPLAGNGATYLLEQLNLMVYRQQQQIERLQRELAQLRQQMPEGSGAAPRNLRDELPPHY